MHPRTVAAFVRRDFLIRASYRLAFLLEWLGIFGQVATFYCIARLFGTISPQQLGGYPGGYFPFALIGIAFSGYLATAIRSFSSTIRQEQLMGTLEAMLVTPTSLSAILISLCVWDFVFSSAATLIYLACGVVFFGLDLGSMNVPATLLVVALSAISFSGIGIVSAAFTMMLKRGDPVSWVITSFSAFFAGAVFPVNVLPEPLRYVSYALPLTHSLEALRRAILQGYSIGMLLPQVIPLCVFAVFLVPVAIRVFSCAVKKVKKDGTLTHY